MKNKLKTYFPFILFITCFLLIIELLVKKNTLPAFIIPAPSDVFFEIKRNFNNLVFKHLKITLFESILGFFFSLFLGSILALAMFYSKLAKRIFYPLILVSQTIPTIALSPIFILWFGYSLTSKIAMSFLISFFPIVIGLFDGFKAADQDAVDLFQSMGSSKLGLLLHLYLPAALPNFFSALKLAAIYSLIGATIGEWLGSSEGLGYYTRRMAGNLNSKGVFAGITLLAFSGMFIFFIVTLIEKYCFRWKKKGN